MPGEKTVAADGTGAADRLADRRTGESRDGGTRGGADGGISGGAAAGRPVRLSADALARGELTVRGQVREASNAVLYCTITYEGATGPCVYKPVAGERPLWDFPDGTLAQREVAAYELSRATGWDLIPTTVLRDGPYGQGMVQEWIEAAPEDAGLLALVERDEPGPGWKPVGFAEVGEGRTALLVHADDERLRRLAVLDAVINNGDRKGGHLLPAADGRLYAIDHGVTFNADDKLRTLLWGWAGEPLTEEARTVLERLATALAEGAPLATRLAALITGAELAALRARVADLLRTGVHPRPGGDWPPIPWPPV
ncbi:MULTISPECIES: SCO1664 family protein [Streptomyces]|uniref:SCO1664 family protein n=2 Tax=Streptomyces rimosus subsp. rimosus TaxID=132474 RepID=A0A8A1UJK5_STRR1|nr:MULTISPECIES: SCO1664 family protein [Streptomyces]MYT41328.1 SCO1664 family protein [Streptomyces sp. SID5471]QDA10008.1 phosphatidylinositol kinase [Streptomyces rimosus]QEV81282.1 SCO1664 family protein [Streptomyces rimosus]QGY67009.1 SCO1664 family protein [Streptomyces rimosus R6-500]QST80099.1 SCO1664 family protein [Streptomyces rimosus subsp. rimosus ATCC 10970]